jgi:hypothetical protein
MPTVAKFARATTRESAVWRTCPACDRLAAMAPDALFCDACAATTDRPTGEGVQSR